MNTKWKDMTSMQKVGFIIYCLGAVLVVVSIIKPDLSTTLAIAVMCVGEAVNHWQKSRKWAYLFAGGAVIAIACFVLELCL